MRNSCTSTCSNCWQSIYHFILNNFCSIHFRSTKKRCKNAIYQHTKQQKCSKFIQEMFKKYSKKSDKKFNIEININRIIHEIKHQQQSPAKTCIADSSLILNFLLIIINSAKSVCLFGKSDAV